MMMEKEEEEEELFPEWPAEEEEQESTEDEDEDEETERKSGLDISMPCVSLTSRRASLPCLAQLSAMHLTHLTHLHMATMAPSPVSMTHQLKDGEARKGNHLQHARNQDEENKPKRERQPSAIPNLLHVPEKRGRFRGHNVLSLSDADSVCLICHEDLRRRRGGTIRELYCSHTFHRQWLWMKQTCPICHKHMPLYWTSAHVKVP